MAVSGIDGEGGSAGCMVLGASHRLAELIAEQGMEHMVRQRDGSNVKLSSVRDAIMLRCVSGLRLTTDEVLDLVVTLQIVAVTPVSGIDAEGKAN